ncbi:MAG: hypothetical protein D8B40_02330 [Leptotrichia sp.]|uniref:Uncharacterized protein n=1 Tax=Leptotrichia rugosa TaxID=3239302 RepID=A0AB39VIG3_9FUSO|nr:hypothetical protein [Leptotrichia sp. oral taxon 498]ASQ47840.1 hypothetical protein BCB68_01955 [Leptotrichia sp. oral taxon 498]RKW35510.1 MAG: hypothetical protein D8B40_02330 [Leptotrichia sp.]
MFEKFRFENLSKIIQLYVLNLFGQIIKKDNLEIFSKINFFNVGNISLLYEKNKKILINKSSNFLKLLDEHILNSEIDLSFIENVDVKKLIQNFEKLCANGYKNFIEKDIRKKIIEKFTNCLKNLVVIYLFSNIKFNYISENARVKISRAPPFVK